MPIIPQFVPELFRPVVAGAALQLGKTIYYRYGHREEIVKDLAALETGKTTKGQKYPLIWLVMDFEEDQGNDPHIYSDLSASFIIATGTQPDWTEEERRDKTFIPILLPIYGAFLDQINSSSSLMMPYTSLIKRKFLLRPYWGNGAANIFNDFCDVIEIKNLKLAVRQQIDCNE